MYFVNNEFDTVIFNSVNAPKGRFEGVGVGFGKLSYVKVGGAIPRSKDLLVFHRFGKKFLKFIFINVFRLLRNVKILGH